MKRLAYSLFIIILIFSCNEGEDPCVYTQKVIDYYLEITGTKYSQTSITNKWVTDLFVRISGYPTSNDITQISDVINELNKIQEEVDISIVSDGFQFNVEVHFIPRIKFDSIINVGNTTANGLAVYYLLNDNINNAIICIASDENHLPTRFHAIREELTQILGLPNDSYSYPNSIFWEGGGYIPNEYLEIDKLIIQMHYSSVIKSGMTADEIQELVCWR
jgi:hypothetical protein